MANGPKKTPSAIIAQGKSTALTRVEKPLPAEIRKRADFYLEEGRGAQNSRRAYRSDWKIFTEWCAAYGRTPLPASPDTVIGFLTSQAELGYALATLERRVVSISVAHKAAEAPSPTKSLLVERMMTGLRKEVPKVRGPQRRAAPLLASHLRAIIPKLPNNRTGARDSAILLVGFATGLRRSNLAELRVRDIKISDRGVLLYIARSKTDQLGKGTWLAVHRSGVKNSITCPVRALERWLALNKKLIGADRLFGVTDSTIYRIVKRAVSSIGLDPKLYSGHSMRAGLVTEADSLEIDRNKTRRQTGHKSEQMLERYVRPEDAFKNNVTEKLGL